MRAGFGDVPGCRSRRARVILGRRGPGAGFRRGDPRGVAPDHHGEEESCFNHWVVTASLADAISCHCARPGRPARLNRSTVAGARRRGNKFEETEREICRSRIPMRLGAARLQQFVPCAQHILLRSCVIERGDGATRGYRTGDRRRVSAALWPPLALRLLPRFLAPPRLAFDLSLWPPFATTDARHPP